MITIIKKILKDWRNIDYAIFVISLLIFTIAILFTIVLLNNTEIAFSGLNGELTGNIGSFFGGTIGTLFSFLSFLLIMKTFKVQQEQAETQKNEIKQNQINYLNVQISRLEEKYATHILNNAEIVKNYNELINLIKLKDFTEIYKLVDDIYKVQLFILDATKIVNEVNFILNLDNILNESEKEIFRKNILSYTNFISTYISVIDLSNINDQLPESVRTHLESLIKDINRLIK